ncbi:16S rRNA (guanine(966)-N(2))-methyltransferase RsmD [Mitsuokella sp. AF21-1AC]|uniref:16S rRNA (guanine(966)-N(2))-methyltransferase RsmD n=1 Tax=Mitsuokella sp. AF21-1AC TaxID=2292235 RepID=UPI000E4818E3|nr:16S rRNA (guanine(966)-N(2))-methyltransferase RsmD [Mitsuokella sp. AF21-1AC]RGS74725.1 16S rRNA (guanine(966)-N(2))-methyltransferase RsmD [Mitsuokella sp. AF21-1AC]
MRIITGSARGCRLKTPKGQDTRPTADRVKESLFNILGSLVAGRHVLDIFAGTGNLGLEALSRGASKAVFVDQATAPLIRENAIHTKFLPASEIHGGDVFASLARLAAAHRSFDLVFCDPPYHKGLWQRALQVFDTTELLAHDGILVVEHGADESELPPLSGLVCVENRRYGHTTQLSFFQWRSYVEEDDA